MQANAKTVTQILSIDTIEKPTILCCIMQAIKDVIQYTKIIRVLSVHTLIWLP